MRKALIILSLNTKYIMSHGTRKKEVNTKSSVLRISLALIVLFYIGIISGLINKPIVGWEVITWNESYNIFTNGIHASKVFIHPTLHILLITLCFNIFGVSEFAARIPGIVSFLTTLFVIFLTIKYILNEKGYAFASLLSCLIFALNPLSINGSMVIDFTDTTLLTLSIMTFYMFFFKFKNAGLISRILILGTVFSLCFWSKLTTSLAVPMSVFIYYSLNRKPKEGIILSVGIFIIGSVIFGTTWFFYCLFIGKTSVFLVPFAYLYSNFSNASSKVNPNIFSNLLMAVLKIGLWNSFFLIILVFLASLDNIKSYLKNKVLEEENLLVISSFIIISVYLYIGIEAGGFPKYITPAVPLLSCYIGVFMSKILANNTEFIFSYRIIPVFIGSVILYAAFF